MSVHQFRSQTMVLALLAGVAWSPGAVASSLYTVTATGWYAPGTSDSDPVAAGATETFTNASGTWSAVSTASAFVGSGGRTTLSGCLVGTVGQDVCSKADTTANTQDTVRIVATTLAPVGTVVSITFDWIVDGTVQGYGAWSLTSGLSLTGVTLLGTAAYGRTTGGSPVVVNETVHEVRSFTANLVVGTTYTLQSRFDVGGMLRTVGSGPFAIDVDFSDTGKIQAAVQTSGLGPLQLLGDSGRDYLMSPVPVPPAVWLFGSALGAMGMARRKLAS
jgi:hypothetical protein